MTDEGILNMDFKTRNFIVHNDRQCGFKVFMIDFGLCRFAKNAVMIMTGGIGKPRPTDGEDELAWALGKELKEGFVYQQFAQQGQEELDCNYMME